MHARGKLGFSSREVTNAQCSGRVARPANPSSHSFTRAPIKITPEPTDAAPAKAARTGLKERVLPEELRLLEEEPDRKVAIWGQKGS